MTIIKGIENEIFNVTGKTDISNLTSLLSLPLGQQMDDKNYYELERVLDGRKTAQRTYTCVKVDGEFVKIF